MDTRICIFYKIINDIFYGIEKTRARFNTNDQTMKNNSLNLLLAHCSFDVFIIDFFAVTILQGLYKLRCSKRLRFSIINSKLISRKDS